ncbi:hypothetical protein B0I18_103117 [Taibaiella chishuiensis]|uniref:Uncharacterized protein n=2 Tax=Taibaiella chishuiensis TaxID=1434707 RepID=A0A2P8D5P8_9BACT|nr:hypothetical protein B0I18_103117 [Taibaiella chishuiensis]
MMMNNPDLKIRVADWLDQNRGALPLNSLHWEPLLVPPASGGPDALTHCLGKYDARVQQTDFFYKAISKIP